MNDLMKEQVALGFNQMELGMMIPINTIPGMGPFVYASSDEQLIYNWELPDYITDHLEDDSLTASSSRTECPSWASRAHNN